MSQQRQIRIGLICGLVVFAVLLLTAAVAASTPGLSQPRAFEPSLVDRLRPSVPLQVDGSALAVPGDGWSQVSGGFNASIRAQQSPTTTLTVNIISSPWAVLDHNDPGGTGGEVPNVFVVEAVITNTGTFTATELVVNLDYNEDPVNNWILLPGENPVRTMDELVPQTAYHAYWFARYYNSSAAPSVSHQYTVTAAAENASPVATSDNYYGELDPGETVKTLDFQSTGNSGVVQSSADVMVGVAFTVTVSYDLGQNPQRLIFSPAGNIDFDPRAYRLVESAVRFFNDAETQESVVADRLYFPTLPSFAENAEVTYTFMALTPSNTRLCSYTGVFYQSTNHYDQFFCDDVHGTIAPITGTLTLSMTKQAGGPTIQQGELLTYTIDYTNTGTLPLNYAWVWDDVDAAAGSIITTTVTPPGDPDLTTDSRVAWYLGQVQGGYTRTLTFEFLVDGEGQDLDDNTPVVNHAFFGINQGDLPDNAALTSTITTIVQAPVIALSNSDGQATAEPGDALTYILRITNSGSITATGLVITDVLPAEVNYTALDATPDETSLVGQTLGWSNLGPIPPNGGIVVITVPVTVDPRLPNETVLANTMTVQYENPAGWVFATETAMDTTTVNAPILAISKSDFPDPALTGREITYTLHYTNSGPAAATNVLITDVVPLSTTYQTCSGGVTCDESSGTVSWTIGTVPSSANGTASFSVQVSDTLETGTLIHNEDYGIVSDQTNFVSGTPVTTLVEKDKAIIEGTTFEDADGDGERDAGESGIPGVTVTLDGLTATTTDLDGHYVLTTTVAGVHTVVETDPSGYFSTTPNEVHVEASMGNSYQVDFGDALTSTSDFATIYGTVFEDTDGDGEWDAGELGIPGVTVTLDGLTEATTDLYGSYTFVTAAGVHTVVETDLSGYFSTTPNEVHVEASTGNSYQVDFGDAVASTSDFATIYGTVFEDTDGDGERDAGELGIPGATVTLDGLAATTTDPYGGYTFATAVGVHTVVETDLSGYFSTTPNEVHVEVSVGNSYRVDFGDALSSTSGFAAIYGTVFEDTNSDEEWDAGELGIPGATVTLDGLTATITDLYGNYTFATAVPGTHSVVETDPPFYSSTTPNNVTLAVELGQGYQVDFGDVPVAACVCPPDSYEDDDAAGRAADLSVGVRQVHDFCDDAIDWSILTAQAGSVYTITTSSWGQRADTFLALFDSATYTLLAANDDYDGTTDYSSRIVWQAPASGVYYVRTTNQGGLTRCETGYEVWMEQFERHFVYLPLVMRSYSKVAPAELNLTGVINHACPDDYEPDDTWQQAQAIEAGIVQVHSFDSDPTYYATDKDLVWFDILDQQTITFTTAPMTNTLTLLELYDEYGTALDVTGTGQLVWTAPDAGRYYLSVRPRTTTFGCASAVGYNILAEIETIRVVYLPVVMRNFAR